MDIQTEILGEVIKKERKKAGLTQAELGRKLGVSASMIAQYETGKRIPKIATLQKIARALGVDFWQIIPTKLMASPLSELDEETRNQLLKIANNRVVVGEILAAYLMLDDEEKLFFWEMLKSASEWEKKKNGHIQEEND